MLVEVCANSLESAINAQKAGADRIELCSELAVGGITPSYGLLKAIKDHISIPVHVLIRPRSGDFTFSESEFEIMKTDIALCIEMGFDGIVSGVLKKDYTLDTERTKQLIEASEGLKFTFYRAFDWVKEPFKTLEQLEAMGVNYILSSGQHKSAIEGIDLLGELQHKASTSIIMPGSGVNGSNIEVFMKKKVFKAIHLSGTELVQTMASKPKISMNSPAFLSDDKIAISNEGRISAVVNKVK
ncbi:copper homeostasis protein CutC [Maribacter aestuarii]|uniref:copper homeostasis protein CutC n=1 Tax=Maribacter aestuarii TaxID=1130723 RepID=UPI00248CE02A|nr:copper homeostasis protein CutC [Maribacter aestuarii]